MAEKYADVLIIGCDLPGLIAAAFLAKRGLAVMVLNPDESVESKKKNVQPNLISHLSSRLFKSILGKLSIPDSELGIVNRYQTPYQIVLPRHRLDVTVQRDRFYRELKREFPQQADAIRSFYLNLDQFDLALNDEEFQQHILPQGLLARWHASKFMKKNHLGLTVSDWLKTFHLDEEVAAFIDAQVKFLSNLHAEPFYAYPLAKLLANENSVLFDVKGGMGHLKKLFLNKMEFYSGKIRNNVKIEKLLVKGRRMVGADLGSFEGEIHCRTLLWNQPRHQISSLLPDNFSTRRLLKKLKKIEPRYARFSVSYEVEESVIPVGMKSNVLVIRDPSKPLVSTNFLHLHFYQSRELEQKIGFKTLFVTYLLEMSAFQESDEEFDRRHQSITDYLHELMPFSEQKLKLTFPQLKDKKEDDLLFELEESDFKIFKSNAADSPIYEVRADRFAQLFPFQHQLIYKNLTFTGSEILSVLGFEGELILGMKVLENVWSEFEGSKKKAIRQRRIA